MSHMHFVQSELTHISCIRSLVVVGQRIENDIVQAVEEIASLFVDLACY